MNAAQRRPWLDLGAVPLTLDPTRSRVPLCCRCQYHEVETECGEYYPVYSYLVCTHPLPAVAERLNDGDLTMYDGGDCWGFRPSKGLTIEAARAQRGVTAQEAREACELRDRLDQVRSERDYSEVR